jgi:hypothetical protein
MTNNFDLNDVVLNFQQNNFKWKYISLRIERGKLLTISLFVAFSIHHSSLDFGQTMRKRIFEIKL